MPEDAAHHLVAAAEVPVEGVFHELAGGYLSKAGELSEEFCTIIAIDGAKTDKKGCRQSLFLLSCRYVASEVDGD
jgi:hypothetical protein